MSDIRMFFLGMMAGAIIAGGLVWLTCCQEPPTWPQQQACYLESYGPGERRVYLCDPN
jgi:hypothetical protein